MKPTPSQSLTPEQSADLIRRLEEHVTSECRAIDTDLAYEAMLDEIYDLSQVGGPFSGMLASRVLKECDPIAYRCGMSDWLDGESYVEVDGSYYKDDDVEEARESFAAELQKDLDDAERELDSLNEDGNENGGDEGSLGELRSTIARLEAEIALAEKHSF